MTISHKLGDMSRHHTDQGHVSHKICRPEHGKNPSTIFKCSYLLYDIGHFLSVYFYRFVPWMKAASWLICSWCSSLDYYIIGTYHSSLLHLPLSIECHLQEAMCICLFIDTVTGVRSDLIFCSYTLYYPYTSQNSR